MSSTIDPETFVRPSLTIIATVDVSGSMGWSYGDSGTPAALSVGLLHAIAAELGAGDRVAIVTYGSTVNVPLGLTAGDDQAAIHATIDELHEGGSTNMEAGLKKAYELAHTALGSTDEVRLMLFTDVRPNVGATTPSEFETMAASNWAGVSAAPV